MIYVPICQRGSGAGRSAYRAQGKNPKAQAVKREAVGRLGTAVVTGGASVGINWGRQGYVLKPF